MIKKLIKYKDLVKNQIIMNQGDLAIIKYIRINDKLEKIDDSGKYAMVRIKLVNKSGIPFANTTQPYEMIQRLNN